MCNKGYKGRISFTIDHTTTTNPKNLEYRCLNRCPTCEGVSEIIYKEGNENAGDNGHGDDIDELLKM